jgi:6-phosphogluconolactonase
MGQAMKYHVYVSNSLSNYFSKFVMEEGTLTKEADIQLGDAPGTVATTADGRLMFVCLRSAKQLESFSVDRTSGQLSSIAKVDLHDGPAYVKTDNTDHFLLSAYYRAGQISVHGIAADGSLSKEPMQLITTDEHAHSIQMDRSNQFAFVPHTNPVNAIYQFRFDAKTGQLTANEPREIQPDTPEGPRHFAFHPTKDLLYSINENGSTVSAHTFYPEAGTLESFQVISTLPEGFTGENLTTAEIRMTHDGRHLYASNRGHDSLAIFSVNVNGTLVAEGHQPTEATPRFFDLDPTGNFILAVGQGSGRLATYRIDHKSGHLEPIETHDVGESPLWIQFAEVA